MRQHFAAVCAMLVSTAALLAQPSTKPATPPTDPTPRFAGIWHNQLGSEMELKFDASTGAVTGWYRNHANTPTPDAQYPLVGTVNGDVISFTVNWSRPITQGSQVYSSITSWVGQHTIDTKTGEKIMTFWHLERNVPDDAEKESLWQGTLEGADTFERGNAPKE